MIEERRSRRTSALALAGIALVVAGVLAIFVSLAGGDDTAGPTAGTSSTAVTPTPAPGPTSDPAPSTAPVTGAGLGVGWAPEVGGRRVLRGFSQLPATITDADGSVCTVCLLAATDGAQRERGLMEITDEALGGHDGMVFVYDSAIDGAFWMRNTPMPLSIAYFGDQGAFVSSAEMEPCADRGDCPSYPADGEFRYAVEVPAGGLQRIGVGPGAVLDVGSGPCPKATAP